MNIFSFDDPRAAQWLKAGLYPAVITINGVRCLAYLEQESGLIFGVKHMPCPMDEAVVEINYTSSNPLKIAAFMATLEDFARLNLKINYFKSQQMTHSNEPTIPEMNETIALFMGYEKVRVGYFGSKDGDLEYDESEWQVSHEKWMDDVGMESVGFYFVNVPANIWHEVKNVEYHTSWDWLMPVVEMQDELSVPENEYELAAFALIRRPIYTPISTVHGDVYQFIIWLNQQKQNNG